MRFSTGESRFPDASFVGKEPVASLKFDRFAMFCAGDIGGIPRIIAAYRNIQMLCGLTVALRL